MIDKMLWVGIFIAACMPVYAFYQRSKNVTPEIDKAVFERVFLKCVETAKGPNSLTASGNDLDEAIAECRFTARQIAEK